MSRIDTDAYEKLVARLVAADAIMPGTGYHPNWEEWSDEPEFTELDFVIAEAWQAWRDEGIPPDGFTVEDMEEQGIARDDSGESAFYGLYEGVDDTGLQYYGDWTEVEPGKLDVDKSGSHGVAWIYSPNEGWYTVMFSLAVKVGRPAFQATAPGQAYAEGTDSLVGEGEILGRPVIDRSKPVTSADVVSMLTYANDTVEGESVARELLITLLNFLGQLSARGERNEYITWGLVLSRIAANDPELEASIVANVVPSGGENRVAYYGLPSGQEEWGLVDDLLARRRNGTGADWYCR